MAVLMKIRYFWDDMLCRLVKNCQLFGRAKCSIFRISKSDKIATPWRCL